MFGENKYPGSTSVEMTELAETTRFRDINITPLPYMHGSTPVLGFRLNDFSYLTDVKSIPEETRGKIRGSRVMVLSGLRWEPGHPTHLTIPEAVEIATELEIPKTYLIHMNSYVDHKESNRRLPAHVRLAFDQLEITI